jgi:AraC family transcriptional regulator, 4-hydroxyphenylacetate 3-monooxygenase operon regulatory protein
MAAKLPSYQEDGARYEADTCVPVVQATQAGQLYHTALVHGHYPGRKLPGNVLPGLKSVGFWNADHPQEWGLNWHRNEGLELTFLESGSLAYAVDDYTCTLKPGDLTIARPWQLHRVGNPYVHASRLHWVNVDVGVRKPHQLWHWPAWLLLTAADLRELTDMLRHNEQPVWHATPEIHLCIKRIGQAVESDTGGSHVSYVTVYLNELFVHLLHMLRGARLPLDKSLSSSQRSVKLFWHELCGNRHALQAEWTVAGMARRCGLGVTYFTEQTKRLTNTTPLHYLNQCRLIEAARLLREQHTRDVTEVALDCGFSSGQYFATLFRHQFGCTPSSFRRSDAQTARQ